MSRIAIIGVTGYAGDHIASDALGRGHSVIGVSRTPPDGLRPGVEFRPGSIEDHALMAELFTDVEMVIVAIRAAVDGQPFLVGLIPDLLALAAENDTRLGIIGGGASLSAVPGGPRLIDAPDFPPEFKADASAQAEVLDSLRASDTTADWFYVSPPAGFGAHVPGERTGRYRLGDDVLLSDAHGVSAVGGADFALAVVDELDRPAHHQTRFTVAY